MADEPDDDSVGVEDIAPLTMRADNRARLDYIVDRKIRLTWRRGVSAKACAKAWGLSMSSLNRLTGEADDIVGKLMGDPKRHIGKLACALDEVIDRGLKLSRSPHQIHKAGPDGVTILEFDPTKAHNSVINAARELAKLVGANASIKVTLAQSDATRDELKELGEMALLLAKGDDEE